ncbi:MarR family transcriptional regulator [Staphylococcus sp. IVB6181]|uniref:transcriptional regulator, SarA/Rot family n=1 Tax=Staphylococcus sp. IVB6181 TaxID=2929481 RepID=UPI0021CFA368|nr:MarR family transcriptional regulator [Staphylococcus sp. IVB6181]UXV35614.1 MarR family transcriptional regulator [Staphylococcus sp. IVB6181]
MNNKNVINDLSKFVTVAQKVREVSAIIKSEYQISFEELFILNYIHNSEKERTEFNVKEIIQLSNLKPYFISKAIQKLKERKLLSKKRNKNDERTVILVVDAEQRSEIEALCDAVSKVF